MNMEKYTQIYNRMLKHFVGSVDKVETWFQAPHRMLDEKSPIDLIEDDKHDIIIELINNTIDN